MNDKAPVPPADAYLGLRQLMLGQAAETVQVHPEARSEARVVVVDIGVEDGTVTLAAVADGTASMYTSVGGGILGAGEHATVRAAAFALLREADVHWERMEVAAGVPALPSADRVRFTVRRTGESRSIEVPERELTRGRDPLSALYGATHRMITEIRLLDERRAGG